MSLEGRVTIAVDWDGRRVTRASVHSSRPRQPGRVLIGRSPAEAVALVPLLFSLCGRAQAVAAAMACERAVGASERPAIASARALLVAAETVQEHAWRILLDWPSAVDEPGDLARLAAAHRHIDGLFRKLGGALEFSPPLADQDVSESWEERRRELCRLLGDSGPSSPDPWIGDAAAVDAWIAEAASPAARVLSGVRAAGDAFRARTAPLMPPTPPEGLVIDLARGLLIHRVRLDDDRKVGRYDIVAPTEWNLHPRGALATEFPGLAATDERLLRRRVSLLAHSLDPCVAFTVSVGHA